MPSDLRVIDLPTTHPAPIPATTCRIRRLTKADAASLAVVYRDSYPPEIGAADLAEAEDEMAATFAGEYGVLRMDASHIAEVAAQIVGAILVTERSIWDAHVTGPFIIDLFVRPPARHKRTGSLLVLAAIEVCRATGDNTLSLRVGAGTSPAAFVPIRATRLRRPELTANISQVRDPCAIAGTTAGTFAAVRLRIGSRLRGLSTECLETSVCRNTCDVSPPARCRRFTRPYSRPETDGLPHRRPRSGISAS